MALPKEPRQKMINMMYLVLTALLALNVSSEILNAFKTVKASLERSSDLAESKNLQLFRSFEEKMREPSTAEKAKLWYTKADQARKYSDDAYKYIEELKKELMKESGYNPPSDTILKEDNLDAATRLFVEAPPEGKAKGKELEAKLKKLREDLLNIDPEIKTLFEKTLPIDLTPPPTKNEGNKEWSAAYFRMTPTIAALTILSKFQNDIKNSEAQIVEHCHKKIGEVVFTYDQFQVIANSSSTYMMPGEEFTINAGIGAYSSKARPTITVNGASATPLPTGDYELKSKAEGSPGEYSKTVVVSYVDPNTGKPATVNKIIKYTVGAPAGLTVSTDKTRVFYAGLPNLLSVTGSGGAEQVEVTVEGAGASVVSDNRKGQYTIECKQTGKATIIATDKKSKQTTRVEIPVKRVPNPIAKIGSSAGGSMTVQQFKAQQGVIASLGDFVYDGVKFDVVSFVILFSGAGFEEPIPVEVNGNSFATVAQYKARCEPNTTIMIGNIKVKGPEGTRNLDQTIGLVLE